MILEDLVKAGKLNRATMETYLLFERDELGRKWLQNMMKATFMSSLKPNMTTTNNLGFLDGRRSIIRDIMQLIDEINQLMETENARIDSRNPDDYSSDF